MSSNSMQKDFVLVINLGSKIIYIRRSLGLKIAILLVLPRTFSFSRIKAHILWFSSIFFLSYSVNILISQQWTVSQLCMNHRTAGRRGKSKLSHWPLWTVAAAAMDVSEKSYAWISIHSDEAANDSTETAIYTVIYALMTTLIIPVHVHPVLYCVCVCFMCFCMCMCIQILSWCTL